MAKRSADTDLRALAGEVLRDCGKLVGQQLELLQAEVAAELRRAGRSAWLAAAGGGLAASGGLLSGLAVAHLLHRVTRLPLWACYAGAAGACGAAGAALLREGGRGLAGIRLLPPPETAAALKENVAWLKEQLDPAAR